MDGKNFGKQINNIILLFTRMKKNIVLFWSVILYDVTAGFFLKKDKDYL